MMNRNILTALFWLLVTTTSTTAQAATATISVHVDTRHPFAAIDPSTSIGAAVDGYQHGDIAKIYTKANVNTMLSAGLGPISYRLRTELGIEAWHWNPRGRWSDPAHKCGYWTSSTKLGRSLSQCYGYALPRRGDTLDQANNSSYSRIDDGDPRTFWKSNPYLSKPPATEDHPQWIVVELAQRTPVDTVRIVWGEPYARRYEVQYWAPDNPNEDPQPVTTYKPGHIDATFYQKGEWRTFPNGVVDRGHGGVETIRLWNQADGRMSGRAKTSFASTIMGNGLKPQSAGILTSIIRIVMLSSSGTGPKSDDIRDRLGYAVRELYVGSTDARGHFHDVLQHGKTNKTQSVIYVSSTDPWHRASDIDYDVEQPGFDRMYRNGMTRGMSMMVPVGVAYDTPANAAAEVEYLERRGYPVDKVELGEEPDGQYIAPEDYGALYVEFARALHRVDPRLRLGGPSFQTMAWDEKAWPVLIRGVQRSGATDSFGAAPGETSWTKRFIDYLRAHGELKDLAFFSSEFYFYNDVCSPASTKVIEAPRLVDKAFARWWMDGVPSTISWYATEFGYSPYAAEPEVDLPGALLDADFIAHFLSIGGSTAYFYGVEPNSLIKEVSTCDTWGNLALWQSDDDREIIAPFAAYWIMRMVTRDWLGTMAAHTQRFGPQSWGNRTERAEIYPVNVNGPKVDGEPVVTAYAVRRAADASLAVMMINKSDAEAFRADVDAIPGRCEIVQYSARDYVWHAHGEHGYASPNRPPDRRSSTSAKGVTLPPFSITVIRGKLGN